MKADTDYRKAYTLKFVNKGLGLDPQAALSLAPRLWIGLAVATPIAAPHRS